MGLSIYISNDLNNLAQKLAQDFRDKEVPPFVPQCAVTQTDGMNKFLKRQIAENCGIVSNIQFFNPSTIIRHVYNLLGGTLIPPVSQNLMLWCLYDILNSHDFKNSYPDVSNYYEGDEVKRLNLSEKLADLFDQYQIYRAETVLAWENPKSKIPMEEEWQCWLWRELRLRFGGTRIGVPNIVDFVLKELKNPQKQQLIKDKVPIIQLFGLAVITPFYLQIFNKLSEFIDVSFYLRNPAPEEYWIEDKTLKYYIGQSRRNKGKIAPDEYVPIGNTLLIGMGGVIKESFRLLFKDDKYINLCDNSLAVEPPLPKTLLQKIQYDVFFNAHTYEKTHQECFPVYENDLTDGSLTIQSCFTPKREAEALYNYLVKLTEEYNGTLSAEDILVMVSDVSLYSSYIKAVFDEAPYKFKYSISDESVRDSDNLFSALYRLFTLDDELFKADDILSLLESSYICERFKLDNISLIRNLLQEAHIKYGLTGDKENQTYYVSWEYGLKSLLWGICIGGKEEYKDADGDSIYPVDAAEGKDSNNSIHFLHFIKILRAFIEERQQVKTLEQWMTYTDSVIANLILDISDKENEEYDIYLKYREKILTDAKLIPNLEIPFSIFKEGVLGYLETAMNEEKNKKRFGGNGITFCSFVPMRSIPFKVTAMLGVNSDIFPRKDKNISFSLLNIYKDGDRNVKNNDKHLMLETILSAQERLYISYIGQNAKDGTEIPPSSLVDELLDYIVQNIRTDSENDDTDKFRKKLFIKQPLHSFSLKYFRPNTELYTYLGQESNRIESTAQERTPDNLPEPKREIFVTELLSFFNKPVKHYFNNTLNVFYPEDAEEDELGTEVFEINDNLEKWKLENDLIGIPSEKYEEYFQTNRFNKYPLANMGQVLFDATVKEAENFKHISNWQHDVEKIAVSLYLHNDLPLTGELNCFSDGRIVFKVSKFRLLEKCIRHYLSYLMLCAQQEERQFGLFFVIDSSLVDVTPAFPVSKEEALQSLTFFADIFLKGRQEILYFADDKYKDAYCLKYEQLGGEQDPALKEEILAEMERTNDTLVNWIKVQEKQNKK